MDRQLFTDDGGLVAWPQPMRRLFAAEQADRSLVLVERIVEDIIFEHARVADLQETIEAVGSRHDRDIDALIGQMLGAIDSLQACLGELDCVGAYLCDWSAGVVDFPSLAGGREVRLCWRYGESHVSHWHEVDSGCAARQSLSGIVTPQMTVV